MHISDFHPARQEGLWINIRFMMVARVAGGIWVLDVTSRTEFVACLSVHS